MGRVYKAWDQVLGVPVALKVVRPDLAAQDRFRTLFDAEVRVSARFTHPHIVPLHDLGELQDGTPFLGLAFADAGSFAGFRARPPDWYEARRLIMELIDALAHLHARGVLHRDLKPENILLHREPDGAVHVWLADLGLARTVSALAQRKGKVEGTQGFMAPEQIIGRAQQYGPWTDLYSLGVVIWEIVTGELPFPDGQSPLDNIALRPLRPRFAVPADLERILGVLLSRDPPARYDLVADLRAELAAHLHPDSANPAPSLPSPGAPPKGVPEEEDDGSFRPPPWNRPVPPPLPRRPPLPPGMGAVARASLKLFTVRNIPLVARERVRAELWNQMRAVARDGRSRVVLVVGDAGTGKTHFVQDMLWTLEEGGWAEPITLTYQEIPSSEDGYIGAAKQLLRPWNETRESLEYRLAQALSRERGRLDAAVRTEAATLARWAGYARDGEPAVDGHYALKEVKRHIQAHSWRGLGVIFLDNAHSAREEGDGFDLAAEFLPAFPDEDGPKDDRRALVIATVRHEALQDAALRDRLADLVQRGAIRIDLPPLSEYGTRELLAQSLTLTDDLAEQVAKRCEGNPLFARQLLIDWVERGWLEDKGGLRYGLREGVSIDHVLPKDLEAVFTARLTAIGEKSGYPQDFLEVIHTASLAGNLLPRELYHAIVGDFAPYASELWTEVAGQMRFYHGMLHQMLQAQAMARPNLPALHLRLARAWMRYGRRLGQSVHWQVGKHAFLGGSFRMALADLIPAAKAAYQEGRIKELEEAAILAEHAAAALGDQEPGMAWAQYWRGKAWARLGAAREAKIAYEAARTLFEAEGNGLGLVEALLGLGEVLRQSGELSEAHRRFTSAQRRAKAAGDLAMEARAIHGLAWLEQLQRNYPAAEVLFTKALNRCHQDGDLHGGAEATFGHATLSRHKGEFAESQGLYAEAERTFSELGDRIGVARVRLGLSAIYRQLGDFHRSDEAAKEALSVALELGAKSLQMEARLAAAESWRAQGELGRAEPVYEEHLRWAQSVRSFDGAVLACLGLAMVALARQDVAELHERASQAAHFLQRIPEHWLWAPYRLVVAALLAIQGDEDSTYRWLWSAAELGLERFVDRDAVALLLRIAQISAERGWHNALRLAGQHGRYQLRMIGRDAEESELHELMSRHLTDSQH